MSKNIRWAVLVLFAVLVFAAGPASAAAAGQQAGQENISRQMPGSSIRVSIIQPKDHADQFSVVAAGTDKLPEAKDVEIRVWPLSHQSEAISYPAKKTGSAYETTVQISKHKNRVGTYVVAVFVTGKDGKKTFAGGTSTYIPPVRGSFRAEASDELQSGFLLQLSGALMPEKSSVVFRIQGTNSEKPFLLNRIAKKGADGYVYTVAAKDLSGPGMYTVQALCTAPGLNELVQVGAGAFAVDGVKGGAAAEIRVSDKERGTFRISAFAEAHQQIRAMEADVWTKPDRSDLKTYSMVRDGKGWSAEGNVADHNYASGTYCVQTYATLVNGVMAKAAAAEAVIETENCLRVEPDEKGATIHIQNVPAHVQRVQIPTWSVTNGQNDIIWYDAEKTGEGTWCGRIEYRRHKHSGTFRTDAFVDGELASTISYDVAEEHLPETEEMRGVWVPAVFNLDFPRKVDNAEAQKEEFRKIVRNAKEWGMNTLFVQVRPHADAMYVSEMHPWSDMLTGVWGKDPGYDPLAFMLETAHAEGLELHAWLNPYRVCSGNEISKLSPKSAAVQHPEWVLRYKGGVWLDPGHPGVQQHLADTVREIIENYDVDGVHFDDFFYPYDYPLPAGESRDGAVGNQYRENVSSMVRMVAKVVHEAPGHLKFGISPFGIWKNRSSDPAGSTTDGLESYYSNYSDTMQWVREGVLDYVAPQLYWHRGHDSADYATLVDWWAHAVEGTGTDLIVGHGVYKEEVAREIDAQLELNARYGSIQGSIFYRYGDLEKHPEIPQRIRGWYESRNAGKTGSEAA